MLRPQKNARKVKSDKNKILNRYVNLILKNQKSLNLIGKSTIPLIWERHVIDSLQILDYLPKERKNRFLLDVGTGAGFPGVILAIMGRKDVLLCEKSVKKSMFLKNALKECSIDITVHNCNIEQFNHDKISVIVSRAFASIEKLIFSIFHLLSKETTLVIHKGKKYIYEIKEAKKKFNFNVEKFKSITSSEGVILKIKNIKRK